MVIEPKFHVILVTFCLEMMSPEGLYLRIHFGSKQASHLKPNVIFTQNRAGLQAKCAALRPQRAWCAAQCTWCGAHWPQTAPCAVWFSRMSLFSCLGPLYLGMLKPTFNPQVLKHVLDFNPSFLGRLDAFRLIVI